jgi:CRP-like cAMP-binding protein
VRVTAESLRGFRLFRGASRASLEALATRSCAASLRSGEAVFRTRAPAVNLVLVTAGLVRVVFREDGGDPSTLAIFGPRDVVGLPAALEAGVYPADAEVVSKTASIALVPAASLRALAEAEAKVLRGVNDALLEHTRILRAKIDVMTAADVEQRLARLFVHLLDRFGDEREDGSALLPILLQRRQLAELVGVRVETVIRTMRRWEAEGLVASEEGGTSVRKPSALEGMARRPK